MSITTRTRIRDLLFSETAEDVLGEYGIYPEHNQLGLTLEKLCQKHGVSVWEVKADLVEALADEDDDWELRADEDRDEDAEEDPRASDDEEEEDDDDPYALDDEEWDEHEDDEDDGDDD